MAVTETTTTSWGSRLGSSVKGVLVGLGLFILGFPLLFWNEGDTVRTRKALEEGESACVHVESIDQVDPEMEGQLVHMTSLATTQHVLTDNQLGVSTTAIALKRTTEMFQWVEHSKTEEKKNLGGSVTKTTTYNYTKEWLESAVDSSGFKEQGHDNPGFIEFPSEEKRAANVTFGAFRLSGSQIASIGGASPYVFPTNWVCPVAKCVRNGSVVYIPNAAARNGSESNVIRNVVSTPMIGDMRVRFDVVRPHEISIVARQYGDTFVKYTAKNKKSVQLLSDGVKDADEMFASAQSANTVKCWIFRFIGFLMMFFGLSMVFKPISVLGDVVPFIGTILEFGIGLVSFVLALVCALVTIAIAWLFYRPIIGILLLVAAGALVFWLKSRRRKSVPAPEPGVTGGAA